MAAYLCGVYRATICKFDQVGDFRQLPGNKLSRVCPVDKLDDKTTRNGRPRMHGAQSSDFPRQCPMRVTCNFGWYEARHRYFIETTAILHSAFPLFTPSACLCDHDAATVTCGTAASLAPCRYHHLLPVGRVMIIFICRFQGIRTLMLASNACAPPLPPSVLILPLTFIPHFVVRSRTDNFSMSYLRAIRNLATYLHSQPLDSGIAAVNYPFALS